MSNPNTPSKNPKKKMIIALSAIAAVIAVVIVAATVIEPPLFQGAIQSLTPIVTDTDPIVKDSTILDTKIVAEPTIIEEEPDIKLETELKAEPVLVEPIDTKIETEIKLESISPEPVEKSEEEPEPIELAPVFKEAIVATPPDISFAYFDRFDVRSESIYGDDLELGSQQAQLIFRVRNTGTMPAYLKSFATREYGCDGAGNCGLATRDGFLYRFSYDESGVYPVYDPYSLWNVGSLHWDQGTSSFGYFEDTDPINNSLLEIPGLSDTYFVVLKSTSDYYGLYGMDGTIEVKYRQAFIDLSTLKVVDSNGVELSMSIDSADTVTPGTMSYYNPLL